LKPGEVRLYKNGAMVAESKTITYNPMDFKPIFNYIGRGQQSNIPLFKGYMDDFRIYNYALSADEIKSVYDLTSAISTIEEDENKLQIWPVPANDFLNVSVTSSNFKPSTVCIYDLSGNQILTKNIGNDNEVELNISELPTGIYFLKLKNNDETLIKKFVVSR